MKTPTFREQYDKVVGAYLRNELNPGDACACFIGNLLNKDGNWVDIRGLKSPTDYYPFKLHTGEDTTKWYYASSTACIFAQSNGLYNPKDIFDMESNFLEVSRWFLQARDSKRADGSYRPVKVGENKLFEAMESTLLMLRKIHESKGEMVEDYSFKPRQLYEEQSANH